MKKKELLFVTLICFIFVILSMFQTWMYTINTPKGFVFPMVHNYPQDYYYYLSYIKQGIDGNLLTTSRFSPENHPYLLIYVFFPLIGFIGRMITDRPDYIYTAGRIIFGTVLLYLSYYFSSKILKSVKWRLIFLIILILQGPVWGLKNGTLYQEGEFWTGFDPLMKLSFLPHHLFADIFLLLSLIFLIKSIKNKNYATTLFSGLFFLTASWTNAVMFPAGLTAVIVFALFEIKKWKENFFKYCLFFTIPVPALLLMNRVMHSFFPWNIYPQWETNTYYPIDVFFLLKSLGITFILSLFSVYFVIKDKNRYLKIVFGLFIAPLVLTFFFTGRIPISNIRYVQAGQYIAAGILATYMICRIGELIKKKTVKTGFALLITGLFILQFVPSLIASIRRQVGYISGNRYNNLVYTPAGIWEIIMKLDKEGNPDDVVISEPRFSPLIPAFTNKRIVYGHPTLTLNPEEKVQNSQKYFNGNDEFARIDIESKYNIKYIIAPGNAVFSDTRRYKEIFKNDGYKLIGLIKLF